MTVHRPVAAALLAALLLPGCTATEGIEGRWAEPGQCAVERWHFADGIVYRTLPGLVRRPVNERPGEVAVPWGRYEERADGSVVLTRPAPDARETVLLWLPRRDADGAVIGYSLEIREPGGRRYRADAERCPSPTALDQS